MERATHCALVAKRVEFHFQFLFLPYHFLQISYLFIEYGFRLEIKTLSKFLVSTSS